MPDPIRVEVAKHLLSHLDSAPTIVPPPGVGGEWWQQQIELAVNTCNQERADGLLVNAVIYGLDDAQVERWFREAVEAANHDVQRWWKGTCNCDGHLN